MTTNLHQVWSLLGGPVRYFAKSSPLVQGGVCKTVTSLQRAVTNLPNWDFYVTLNPSQGLGVKAKSSDITHWSRVLIDIDPVTPFAVPPYACGLVCGQLLQLIPAVSRAMTVIDSGRGYQIWLAIEPLAIEGRTHAQFIERGMAHLLRLLDGPDMAGCRVDPSCSDLARVARCPGTVNQKTGRTAEILWRYSLAPEHLTPLPAEAILSLAPPHNPSELKPIEHKSLTQLLPYLGQRVATFLTEGVGTPGRHSASYAASASLRELGVPEPEARELVRKGASYCRPQLTREDVDRTVRTAYQKGDS